MQAPEHLGQVDVWLQWRAPAGPLSSAGGPFITFCKRSNFEGLSAFFFQCQFNVLWLELAFHGRDRLNQEQTETKS